MREVKVWINDEEVRAKEGMTVLEAAQTVGIEIPALCHHEKLAPYGACRLCVVELVNNCKSRLVTSCVYPVEEGLVVRTESEPVVKNRKMILELMWARSPGVEPLRKYGTKYGITGVQAIREFGVAPGGPKFDVEPSFCILCGLCVRYCAEVKNKHAIGFIGRGTEREVVFFPEVARQECPGCQECFKICPTGALPSHYALAEARASAQ
jgi:NADH dehydrogenase/NADH:ubiquinone oxidoreductase subunit G